MTEPAYLFTDPFGNRDNEGKGRPGILDRHAKTLTEGLLDLNAIHEAYLVPQADLTPISQAVRAATALQVENARHIMIHALERLKDAGWSRSYSLSSSTRAVKSERLGWEARGKWPSWRPKVDGTFLEKASVDGARTPVDVFVRASEEILVAAPAAFERFRRNPTDARAGRALAELALALADGKLVMAALARSQGGSEETVLASSRMSLADIEFGARLEAFRNGVGPEYRAEVEKVIPSRQAIQAMAKGNVKSLGDVGRTGHDANVKHLIDELGGAREGRTLRWAFNRRCRDIPEGQDRILDPMPPLLKEDEAKRLQDGVADALEHYQRMNHVPGFTGYVKQVLFAAELSLHNEPRPAVTFGLRGLVERVGAELGGHAPVDGARLVFSPVDGMDDVMVGRFRGGREDAPVVLAYLKDRLTRVPGATWLGVVAAATIEDGVPDIEELRDRPADVIAGTNFQGVTQMMEAITDPEIMRMVLPDDPVVGLDYDPDPVPAKPEHALAP